MATRVPFSTVSPEAAVHEIPTVSFSTVSLEPLTAVAPHPSPGVPRPTGLGTPEVQLKGVRVV
jgi:hypothetical protein